MSDVTMLTSLKALLFSSAATRAPADGTGALAVPGEGAADFAQLLSGSIEAAPALQPTAATDEEGAALPAVDPSKADTPAIDIPAGALPLGLATALNAVQRHRNPSLPLPAGLAQRVENAQKAADADIERATPVSLSGDTGQIAPVSQDMADLPVPPAMDMEDGGPSIADQPVVKPDKATKKAAASPERADIVTVDPALDAPPVAQATDEEAADQDESKTASFLTEAEPQPLPVAFPPVDMVPSSSPVEVAAASDAPQPAVVTPAPLVPRTPMPSGPETQPEGSAASSGKAAVLLPAAPAQAAEPSRPATPANAPTVLSASAANTVSTADEASVTPDPTLAAAPPASAIPAAPVQPVKSEALALLQMVREQVAARQPGTSVRSGDAASAPVRTKPERAARTTEATTASPVPSALADAAPQAVASQPSAAPTAPSAVAAAPVVDLSASLGAQVVDMGVAGQWIDGLARDIAGLSAHGAQGRFQINADQLGPVQVDIRQGQDGAAVSLTVASEAAEMALRQDSDRLRLDAGLAAVRITDVKIERVAEAARADSASQQGSQQQPQQHASQQQSAQTAWANSQNMSQSQGQGRWRTQENSGSTPKNAGDPAVLNHDDMRRAGNETLRARYA
jgi:hypothetical protein